MAYDPKNLSVLAYANGFTLWHYRTDNDGISTVASDGYFNAAADMLRSGDRIMLQTAGSSADLDVLARQDRTIWVRVLHRCAS